MTIILQNCYLDGAPMVLFHSDLLLSSISTSLLKGNIYREDEINYMLHLFLIIYFQKAEL